MAQPEEGRGATPAIAQTGVKELRRDLADARDEQIVQIVSLVDAMAVRGSADALLDALRPRLMVLRPPRPATLGRLLFQPLDPVILLPQRWRRDSLGVPRTALGPLGVQFSQSVGAAAELSRAIQGQSLTDRAVVVGVAVPLWRHGAAFFATSDMPEDWTKLTGLAGADYVTIARSISVLLGEAFEVEAISQHVSLGNQVPIAQIKACIGRVADAALSLPPGTGARAVGMLAVILLARLPPSVELIGAISDAVSGRNDRGVIQASEQAIDFALDSIEIDMKFVGDVSEVAAEQLRVAMLLDALETPGPTLRPSLKPRAEKLRRQADAACRARFETDLVERIVRPAEALGPDTTDEQVQSLEHLARDLRRLETTGRRLGGAEHYERCLRKAMESLTAPSGDASCLVDRARLVEILLGSDRAMALVGLSHPMK
jgi:hypothetical protein